MAVPLAKVSRRGTIPLPMGVVARAAIVCIEATRAWVPRVGRAWTPRADHWPDGYAVGTPIPDLYRINFGVIPINPLALLLFFIRSKYAKNHWVW
jgi:hypothetical protein